MSEPVRLTRMREACAVTCPAHVHAEIARHAAWWLDFPGRLATGERATTLVVTADDLQPWRGHARQFARLQDGHFEVVAKEMLADNDANR